MFLSVVVVLKSGLETKTSLQYSNTALKVTPRVTRHRIHWKLKLLGFFGVFFWKIVQNSWKNRWE